MLRLPNALTLVSSSWYGRGAGIPHGRVVLPGFFIWGWQGCGQQAWAWVRLQGNMGNGYRFLVIMYCITGNPVWKYGQFWHPFLLAPLFIPVSYLLPILLFDQLKIEIVSRYYCTIFSTNKYLQKRLTVTHNRFYYMQSSTHNSFSRSSFHPMKNTNGIQQPNTN